MREGERRVSRKVNRRGKWREVERGKSGRSLGLRQHVLRSRRRNGRAVARTDEELESLARDTVGDDVEPSGTCASLGRSVGMRGKTEMGRKTKGDEGDRKAGESGRKTMEGKRKETKEGKRSGGRTGRVDAGVLRPLDGELLAVKGGLELDVALGGGERPRRRGKKRKKAEIRQLWSGDDREEEGRAHL